MIVWKSFSTDCITLVNEFAYVLYSGDKDIGIEMSYLLIYFLREAELLCFFISIYIQFKINIIFKDIRF